MTNGSKIQRNGPEGDKGHVRGGDSYFQVVCLVVHSSDCNKKGEKSQFCVNFRVLNRRMKAGRVSLSNIERIIHEIGGALLFTTSECFSKYWNTRFRKRCREKTTFVCRLRTFKSEFMPFWLMNDPSTIQGLMKELIGKL